MITFNQPPQNIVYNMDKNGVGHIPIKFNATGKNVKLELYSVATKQTSEVKLNQGSESNAYQVTLDLPKGDYKYIISETPLEQSLVAVLPIEINFSIGRVFVIMGHSLANANGEKWVTSPRVRIVEDYAAKIEQSWKDESKYVGQRYRTCQEIWNEKKDLPANLRREYEIGIWGIMAQLISEKEDCNVAIINCAMGGSSVQMWADEAISRPFVHGFGAKVPGVDDYTLYNSGIPYFHFQNVLKHIVAQTGVCAVLVQHGENDMFKTPEVLAKYYDEVIVTARTNTNMPNLPFVLAKSAWLLNGYYTQKSIDDCLAAVDLTIKQTPKTYLGPDTHLLPMSLRQLNDAQDGHFNSEGGKEVARLWSVVLTDSFLTSVSQDSLLAEGSQKVDNPLITANSNPKGEQFMLPFLLSAFISFILIICGFFGIKTSKISSICIVIVTFLGTFLTEKIIKSSKQ